MRESGKQAAGCRPDCHRSGLNHVMDMYRNCCYVEKRDAILSEIFQAFAAMQQQLILVKSQPTTSATPPLRQLL